MRGLLRWTADLMYPPKCMLCQRLLESADDVLCGRCHHDLPEYDAAPRKVEYYEKATVSFFYEGKIRQSILRFKFHGMQMYARQYAIWMEPRIRGELDGMYDMVSWVPCSRRRKWTRGFDQAQLLAQAVAERLGVACACTLRKVRNTPKQSGMPNAAKRRANVLGAYEAVQPEAICGRKILMIDDVLTTGATISECGKVLRMAGAKDLVCAAIAVARRNT